MSVDFLVEIAKLAANSLTTGVVELFFGALLGSLFEFPVPAGLSTPFCFLHQLMLQVAKVFAYQVACNGKSARIKQTAHCPPCMMTQMFGTVIVVELVIQDLAGSWCQCQALYLHPIFGKYDK